MCSAVSLDSRALALTSAPPSNSSSAQLESDVHMSLRDTVTDADVPPGSLERLGGRAQVKRSGAILRQKVGLRSVSQQQLDAGGVPAATGVVESGAPPGVVVDLSAPEQQLLHAPRVSPAGGQTQRRRLLHLGAQRPHAWRRSPGEFTSY